MKDKHPDSFSHNARQALDQSVEDLSPETLDQLNRIRRDAVNETPGRSGAAAWGWWASGSLAAAMLVAAVVLVTPEVTSDSAPELAQDGLPDDMELLAAEDDLELMEEIEFVAWLMEQENAG